MIGTSAMLLLITILLMKTQAQTTSEVNVTLIESAVSKGAVCLDGSPPAYAMAPGFECGSNNWLIYMEGGGWCDSPSNCDHKARNENTGSSFKRSKLNFAGILDSNRSFNPDFYNWNRVYLVYCDGSSFLGDVEEADPEYKRFYRGSRVFDAIMEELLAKGMTSADNVILSGGSAGGLATILHCDRFHEMLPNAGRVKCISDSGFFINAKNMPGAAHREDQFSKTVKLHGLERFLPEKCTSKHDENLGLCLFPENLIDDVKTPLFLLESSFDQYQLIVAITPYIGGYNEWHNCLTVNLTLCNSTQLQIMQEFQMTFIQTLQCLNYSSNRGTFVHTCCRHGHLIDGQSWKCSGLLSNDNKTIAEAIGDWYFDGNSAQHVDESNVPRNCTSTLEC